jgi:hypothetical protein
VELVDLETRVGAGLIVRAVELLQDLDELVPELQSRFERRERHWRD